MTRDFEWDDAKAATNLAKHRTASDEAVAVFADPEIVVVATVRPEDGEDRFKVIRRVGGRVFVVYVEQGETYRLISARRANAREERLYGHHPQDR